MKKKEDSYVAWEGMPPAPTLSEVKDLIIEAGKLFCTAGFTAKEANENMLKAAKML